MVKQRKIENVADANIIAVATWSMFPNFILPTHRFGGKKLTNHALVLNMLMCDAFDNSTIQG